MSGYKSEADYAEQDARTIERLRAELAAAKQERDDMRKAYEEEVDRCVRGETELAAAKGREERLLKEARHVLDRESCTCTDFNPQCWVCRLRRVVAALAEKGTSKQMCAAVTNLTRGPCELPSGHAGPHVGGREPGSEP